MYVIKDRIFTWSFFLGWFKGGALDGIPTEIFDTYPLVLKHYNDIDAHPEIRKWMETRYAKKYWKIVRDNSWKMNKHTLLILFSTYFAHRIQQPILKLKIWIFTNLLNNLNKFIVWNLEFFFIYSFSFTYAGHCCNKAWKK